MALQQIDITKYGFSILQIETASRCNMQCTFCGYPLRRDKESILPEDVVLNVIDSISAGAGFKHLCLSQFNEPLLDKRIYEFIKYAKDRNIPVMIITNGLLLNSRQTIDQLIDAGPDFIKISLQVLSSELFSRVRKVGSDFEKYKEGIFNFLKAAEGGTSEITLDMACNFLSGMNRVKKIIGLEYGDPSVYNTVDEAREDIKDFLRGLQQHIPSYIFNDAAVDRYLKHVRANYLTEPGMKIAENISMKIKPFIYGRKIGDFYPLSRVKPCASKILGILASGCVVPCCMAYDDVPSMGNVRQASLGAILDGSAKLLDEIRTGGANLPSTCRNCLGSPTRRGLIVNRLKNTLTRRPKI